MRAKYIKLNRNKQQSPKTQKKKQTNKQTKTKKIKKKNPLKNTLQTNPTNVQKHLRNTKQ